MYVPERGQEKQPHSGGFQGLTTKKILPTGTVQAASHSGHLSTISLQQSLDVLSSCIQETMNYLSIRRRGLLVASFCLNDHNCTYLWNTLMLQHMLLTSRYEGRQPAHPSFQMPVLFVLETFRTLLLKKFIYLYVWVYEPTYMWAT